MAEQVVASGGRAPRVVETHVVALYDPRDGRIAHIHKVTVFEGGHAVTEAEAVDVARARARKAGHDPERLRIAVEKDPSFATRPHRIDPNTGKFVPIPLPASPELPRKR